MISFFDKNSVDTGLEIIESHIHKVFDTAIEVFLQFNKNCEVYGVVTGTGDKEPLREQIKSGNNFDNTLAISSDSKSDTGNGVILVFNGLDFNTEYAVTVVSESMTGYFGNSKRMIISTISNITELRSCIFRHSADNVDLTGTDIDKIINQTEDTLFDITPYTINKAVQFTGINGQKGIRFNGTDIRYNNGDNPFEAYKFTYYILFKANRTDIAQTLFTQRTKNGGSTTSGFALSIGTSGVNTLELFYTDTVLNSNSNSYAFSDTTNLNLLEVKFDGTVDGSSKVVFKLNGNNLLSIPNGNPLKFGNDYPIGQLAGFSDANPSALDADVYESIYYMTFQNTKEEDAVYNEINRKYNINIIRQND